MYLEVAPSIRRSKKVDESHCFGQQDPDRIKSNHLHEPEVLAVSLHTTGIEPVQVRKARPVPILVEEIKRPV